MKYRIKEVTYSGCETRYYPEYREWFFWKPLTDHNGNMQSFLAIKPCEEFINKHIEDKQYPLVKHIPFTPLTDKYQARVENVSKSPFGGDNV